MSRFGPPLILMALIFALSAQPSTAPDLPAWEVALRKAGHMAGYGLLWLLWWRALGYRRPALAVAITLLYAISDELHQTTVTGRSGTPLDVAIDAAGVGAAGLAVCLRKRGGGINRPRNRHGRPGGQCASTDPRRT